MQRNTDFTKRVKTFLHCVRVAKVPVTDGANEMAIENMALDFDEGSKEAASQRGVSIFIVIILRIRIRIRIRTRFRFRRGCRPSDDDDADDELQR